MPIITTGNTGRRIITPKTAVQEKIAEIYHRHKGVDGYRSMTVYLRREGYGYSTTTIHKYMNTEIACIPSSALKTRDKAWEGA